MYYISPNILRELILMIEYLQFCHGASLKPRLLQECSDYAHRQAYTTPEFTLQQSVALVV